MDELKSISRKLFEDAVEDAQLLVTHAASKCKKTIDAGTIKTIINARDFVEQGKGGDPQIETDFWLAYQYVWELVRPVTAESIKANLPVESPPTNRVSKFLSPLAHWLGLQAISKARRMVNRYIGFTVSVLILLLILQIYWVIGNQLTGQLAALLKRETELSLETSQNQEEYTAIEIRFKQNEIDSGKFQANNAYSFYSSPEWARDTLENQTVKNRLETELESLKSQLERSSAILLVWSEPWNWMMKESVEETNIINDIDQYSVELDSINRQIKELQDQLDADPNGSNKIREVQRQITDLQAQLVEMEKTPETNADKILTLRSQIDGQTAWVNQPGQADQIVSQLNDDLKRLQDQKKSLERQKERDIRREESRQAQLAAQFVLVVLQSYLLPLMYGLLGAGTSVLRSLSKQIEKVTFSEEAGIQHLLRISLGALAGIMVGWFSFLIPGDTVSFVGSVSPLAVAFLVGYNIELFFSLMDVAINWVDKRRSKSTEAEPLPPVKQEGQVTETKDKSDQPAVPNSEAPATE